MMATATTATTSTLKTATAAATSYSSGCSIHSLEKRASTTRKSTKQDLSDVSHNLYEQN